jgi:hypothetical protein
VKFLKEEFKIQCFFHSTAMTDAGKDPSTILITSDLSDVRVGKFLRLVLREQGLNYYIENEGLVVISTMEDLETQLTLQIYDCRKILGAAGLVAPPSKPGALERTKDHHDEGTSQQLKEANNRTHSHFRLAQMTSGEGRKKPATAAEKLIFVIKETIAIATWDDLGGPGTVTEYGGLLVVSQTSAVHEQIGDLLDQLAEKLATPAAK